MPNCTQGDPKLVMGQRLRSILIFWLIITTNDCFTSVNPGLQALQNFDISKLPGLTAQDLQNITDVLNADGAANGAFDQVRSFYATVLTTGNAASYMQSAEAVGNHYIDHNCPASVGELINNLLA